MDLQAEVKRAAAGATLHIAAGTYRVNLLIERAITLVADGEVILDGQHRGSVICVKAPGSEVSLRGLTLIHGAATSGGGLASVASDLLTLERCQLTDNQAPSYGGGGLYAASRKVLLTECVIQRNTARQGAGMLVERECRVTADGSDISLNVAVEGAAVRLRDGAQVVLRGCTVQDNKVVGEQAKGAAAMLTGALLMRPLLELVDVALAGNQGAADIWNEGQFPGTVQVRSSPLARMRLQKSTGPNVRRP